MGRTFFAEFLAEKNNKVSVIEMRPGIETDIYLQNQLNLMAAMGRYGCDLRPSSQLVAIGDDSITIKNVDSGEEENIPADAVAFSVGKRPVNDLAAELEGRANVKCVGDAASIGRIGDATRAGFVPDVLNTAVYDEIFRATTQDAFDTAKYLAKKEGISVGISSGAALFAAIEYAKKPENKGKTIVALLPDSGDRYYSTALFTD